MNSYGGRLQSPRGNVSVTTFIKDTRAAKFGFVIEKHQGCSDTFYCLRRGDLKLDFTTLESAQSWLLGYEYACVLTAN